MDGKLQREQQTHWLDSLVGIMDDNKTTCEKHQDTKTNEHNETDKVLVIKTDEENKWEDNVDQMLTFF